MTSDHTPEDENGHLINEAGELVEDLRCYFCLAEQSTRGVTVVRVDIPAGGKP